MLPEPLRVIFHSVVDSDFVISQMASIHKIFAVLGLPQPYPTAEQLVSWIWAVLGTLVSYYVVFGRRHKNRRLRMIKELRGVREHAMKLEEELESLTDDEGARKRKGEKYTEIRVWMDGAFDMMHYGHMNAFRKGRALGTYLVVGVNSDESITQCKGSPIMRDEERLEAVRGCRWVDEVVSDVPYIMNEEYLNYVIKKYRIDYFVHGDDPCVVDGKDVYASAKELGKFLSIPRTEGVSTTDIVGRMLLCTREHHDHRNSRVRLASVDLPSGKNKSNGNDTMHVRSTFLTTSHVLRLFGAGVKAPRPDNRIVYIAGGWDMFHSGHMKVLKEAKSMGDYLIAGVYGDVEINNQRGLNMPIMNLNERVLSMLGCRYVDDVLIDAPPEITREMVASLNISLVVKGSVSDTEDWILDTLYSVPKELGLYKQIDSPSSLTVSQIINRIRKNELALQAKYCKKKVVENEYYRLRYRLPKKKEAEGACDRVR
eukprot:491046_1